MTASLMLPALLLWCLGWLCGVLCAAAFLRQRMDRHMRTADAAQIEREVRRVRAGPPPPPPQPSADVVPLRLRLVEAEARNSARADWAANRHRRANPHKRHSREYATWAVAYAALWAELEHPEPAEEGARA